MSIFVLLPVDPVSSRENMIDYIKGEINFLEPASVVLEAAGVGYGINITLFDYSALQQMREARLFVHESIREDAHVLFGFLDKEAREMFRLLIGVSGVGPSTARLILSAISVADLKSVIVSGNDAMLKSVKGIGAKMAERINRELKDKIKEQDVTLIDYASGDSQNFEEALAALLALGFNQQPSQKVLKKLFATEPGISLEAAIKKAIKML